MTHASGQDGKSTPTGVEHPARTEDRTEGDHEIRHADLDEVLRRRAPTRVRVAQAVALLVVIAVAAGLVVRSARLGSRGSQAGIATPTAVPLGPILLVSTVSYGTVTLNGATLAGPPPLVVTFRRGVNTATLTAPPFRPRTCHIQWPVSDVTYSTTDGGCNLAPGANQSQDVGARPITPVLVVELPLGMADLSGAMRTQALAAVTAALQSTPPGTRVPAGDYIATGQDASGAIASRRVDAPLRAALIATASGLDYGGDFCDYFGCVHVGGGAAVPSGGSSGKPEVTVAATLTVRWRFGSGGGVVASSAPWSDYLPLTLLLAYDPSRGWSVDQSGTEQLAGFGLAAALTQDSCNVNIGQLTSAAQQHGYIILSPLHDNRLEGCELAVQTPGGANAGHFVLRFGVLLAVDEAAHTLLPNIPLAPANEVAAAGG